MSAIENDVNELNNIIRSLKPLADILKPYPYQETSTQTSKILATELQTNKDVSNKKAIKISINSSINEVNEFIANANKSNDVNELRNIITELIKIINAQNNKINEYKYKPYVAKSDNSSKLNKALDEANNKIEELQKKINDLQSLIIVKDEGIRILTQKVEDKNKEYNELLKANEKKIKKNKNYKEKIKNQTKELNRLNGDGKILREEIQRLKKIEIEYNNIVGSDGIIEITELKQQNEELKEEIKNIIYNDEKQYNKLLNKYEKNKSKQDNQKLTYDYEHSIDNLSEEDKLYYGTSELDEADDMIKFN